SGVSATYYAIDSSTCTPAALATCASYTQPFTVSAEGTHVVSFFSTDVAGNSETPAKAVTIKIDKTQPTLTFGSPVPAPNVNGWNNTDVTVPCAANDVLSGVDSVLPGCPVVLSAEGASVSTSVSVT